MQHLEDETHRRRKLQNNYNIKNNISPKTIDKSLEKIKGSFISKLEDNNNKINISEINGDFDTMELKDLLKKYERKMLNYAKDLRFEDAALIRDKIDKIKMNNLKG